MTWAAASWALVTALILATGPLRGGAIGEALSVPRFGAELLLGTGVGLTAIRAGLELGVPGAPKLRRLLGPALLIAAVWIALLIHALAHPTLEPNMAGKRGHCLIQALLFALPCLTLALGQIKRRSLKISPVACGAVGVASASIPALWMQIACMYSPQHTLTYHAAPIFVFGLLVALVAGLIQSFRKAFGAT
jgi:hypothetical protein